MKIIVSTLGKFQLFKSFGIYMGSALFNAAIPFLMLPVFTRYLSLEDYGIISMFTILSGFFMPFIGLSSSGILSREYFTNNKENFSEYVGNIFFILLISLIPIVIIVYLFQPDIASLAKVPVNFIYMVLIFSFFSFLLNTFLIIIQNESKARLYGFFQIGQTVLNVSLSLAFVVLMGKGWEGRICAQIIAIMVFGILSFYFLVRSHRVLFVFRKQYFFDSLKFGIPLIPHTLGAIVISMSDRFFIAKMVDIETTGLYALAFSIASIIGFIEHSFNLAFAPWLFEKLGLNSYSIKRKIVLFTYLYFFIILAFVFILTFSSPIIFDIFIDKKFEGSQVFVFWIALSFAFSGMYKMVTNYIFYVKKTYILAWVTFGSAGINIVLNYFLIKEYGAVGAAISSAIVSFFFFVFTWIISYNVYQMPWNLKLLTKSQIR
jgi:O-antigen/teichoic acid export membrane protein